MSTTINVGLTRADWNAMTDRERQAYNAGYSDGRENPMAEEAMQRIMRTLGIMGATHAEIAEQVEKRLEGLREHDRIRGELSRKNASKPRHPAVIANHKP